MFFMFIVLLLAPLLLGRRGALALRALRHALLAAVTRGAIGGTAVLARRSGGAATSASASASCGLRGLRFCRLPVALRWLDLRPVGTRGLRSGRGFGGGLRPLLRGCGGALPGSSASAAPIDV